MGQDLVIVSMKIANGKGTKWKMGRPNNQAGCTKLINRQGAIRAGRVSKFSEINKWACPFNRQVRVQQLVGLQKKMSYDIRNLKKLLNKQQNVQCQNCSRKFQEVPEIRSTNDQRVNIKPLLYLPFEKQLYPGPLWMMHPLKLTQLKPQVTRYF